MRVPLSWLKEFVDITLPVEELAERLTRAGLECEGIERIGVEGADLPWDPEKIVIGRILEVRQHPNADRLVLADVDYGADAHTRLSPERPICSLTKTRGDCRNR